MLHGSVLQPGVGGQVAAVLERCRQVLGLTRTLPPMQHNGAAQRVACGKSMGVPCGSSKGGCHLTSKLSRRWWLPSPLSQGGDLDAYIKLHEVRMPAALHSSALHCCRACMLHACIKLREADGSAGLQCCFALHAGVAVLCLQCTVGLVFSPLARLTVVTPAPSCSATPADPAREGSQDDCGPDPVWPGLPQHQASQVGFGQLPPLGQHLRRFEVPETRGRWALVVVELLPNTGQLAPECSCPQRPQIRPALHRCPAAA